MTPQRYRKKPVEIEAIQWDGTNNAEVRRFCQGNVEFPRPKKAAVYDKLHDAWIPFKLTDHIIRGIQDELYPCTDEVFQATYEPVVEITGDGTGEALPPFDATIERTFGPVGASELCQCGHFHRIYRGNEGTSSYGGCRLNQGFPSVCPCKHYEPVKP